MNFKDVSYMLSPGLAYNLSVLSFPSLIIKLVLLIYLSEIDIKKFKRNSFGMLTVIVIGVLLITIISFIALLERLKLEKHEPYLLIIISAFILMESIGFIALLLTYIVLNKQKVHIAMED